jgi:hypothetical protein
LLSLSSQLAKATQSAYSAQEFGKGLTPTIELAAALSEFLNAAMDSLHKNQSYSISPFENVVVDGYLWAEYKGAPCLVDRLIFRALLATIKLILKCKRLLVSFHSHGFTVEPGDGAKAEANESSLSLLKELCFWANLEFRVENSVFLFSLRPRQ